MSEPSVRAAYSDKWQLRFAFFDQHGAPNSASYKVAFKALSSGDRLKVQMNFIAFFFWPIYYLVLGLWKSMLSLLGVALLINLVLVMLDAPESISRGLGFGFSALAGMSANYLYYQQEIKGYKGWNPFRGLF
ncbi:MULTISPECIES: DUF2628 domain-containing protein [Chromobacterium]|uniref:DUF2628 domain-containing protein n=1 Tax=Chromobacterium aquaticum TaxID=467180 RepID=A0ABV8ZQY3_9NEIS|nr:DUF2628 domain-containing protein [Chromobacterium aquaticum]MCD5360642.1 DUF2628 domain-containing protein [Chromobacterium aquaticum]